MPAKLSRRKVLADGAAACAALGGPSTSAAQPPLPAAVPAVPASGPAQPVASNVLWGDSPVIDLNQQTTDKIVSYLKTAVLAITSANKTDQPDFQPERDKWAAMHFARLAAELLGVTIEQREAKRPFASLDDLNKRAAGCFDPEIVKYLRSLPPGASVVRDNFILAGMALLALADPAVTADTKRMDTNIVHSSFARGWAALISPANATTEVYEGGLKNRADVLNNYRAAAQAAKLIPAPR